MNQCFDGESETLTRALLTDGSAAVREGAREALAQTSLKDASVQEAIRAVALGDPASSVRERAQEVLNRRK